MREIDLGEAEPRLDDIIDAALSGEPSVLIREGRKEAVVLSYELFTKMTAEPRLGWLLANAPLAADDLLPRTPTTGFGRSIR